MTVDWPTTLLFQVTWHWERQLRPRLDGITDAEYLWEPVPHAWSIRPRGQARTTMSGGGGDLVAEFEQPEPSPAPVTTIAWRLGHILVGVLGARNASHFGWEPVDDFTKVYPATADQALAELDTEYERWIAGVTGLGDEGLARPIGPSEGVWADHSYADLVLHIHRELIHHGAEIALLRDLYAHRS